MNKMKERDVFEDYSEFREYGSSKVREELWDDLNRGGNSRDSYSSEYSRKNYETYDSFGSQYDSDYKRVPMRGGESEYYAPNRNDDFEMFDMPKRKKTSKISNKGKALIVVYSVLMVAILTMLIINLVPSNKGANGDFSNYTGKEVDPDNIFYGYDNEGNFVDLNNTQDGGNSLAEIINDWLQNMGS